jgi:hypothetical protein
MPTDPATRYAIATMQERPPLHAPVRQVQQWLLVTGHTQFCHLGFSEFSNRVEFRGHDGTIVAVTGTPRASITAAGCGRRPLTAEVADGLAASGDLTQ